MGWISQLLDLLSRPFIWWVIIAPWEGGIRSRLGKRVTVLQPGIHWRFPFIDRVYIQSVRLRMLSDSGQTMTTKNGKVVTISIALQYSIVDIGKVYASIANPEATLIFQSQGLIAQLVSTTDSDTLTPQMIEEKVTALFPANEWGLGQIKVWVTSFAYVRTLRLLSDTYRQFGMNNDLDNQQHVK